MAFTLTRKFPSAKEALASGVAQMAEVVEIGRNVQGGGLRVQGQDALQFLATITTTSEEADFSATFARVSGIIVVQASTGAAVPAARLNNSAVAPSNPARKTLASVSGDAGNLYLITVFGELLSNV